MFAPAGTLFDADIFALLKAASNAGPARASPDLVLGVWLRMCNFGRRKGLLRLPQDAGHHQLCRMPQRRVFRV